MELKEVLLTEDRVAEAVISPTGRWAHAGQFAWTRQEVQQSNRRAFIVTSNFVWSFVM